MASATTGAEDPAITTIFDGGRATVRHLRKSKLVVVSGADQGKELEITKTRVTGGRFKALIGGDYRGCNGGVVDAEPRTVFSAMAIPIRAVRVQTVIDMHRSHSTRSPERSYGQRMGRRCGVQARDGLEV